MNTRKISRLVDLLQDIDAAEAERDRLQNEIDTLRAERTVLRHAARVLNRLIPVCMNPNEGLSVVHHALIKDAREAVARVQELGGPL